MAMWTERRSFYRGRYRVYLMNGGKFWGVQFYDRWEKDDYNSFEQLSNSERTLEDAKNVAKKHAKEMGFDMRRYC